MRRLLILLFAVTPAWAQCDLDASTLTIDSTYRNEAVATAGTLGWSNVNCSGTQTNYQAVLWYDPGDAHVYCNSGTGAKGDPTAVSNACVSSGNYAPDGASYPLWESVRVQFNGDPNDAGWAGSVTEYANRPYARSMRSSAPRNVTMKAGGTYDPNAPVVTWPAAGSDNETFYADPNGSAVADCTAAKVIGTPRTAQVACNCIDGVGDTVIFLDGTYTGRIQVTNKDGNAENPITLQAANTGLATLVDDGAAHGALEITGGDWYVISGFNINTSAASTENRKGIIISGGSHARLTDIYTDPNTNFDKQIAIIGGHRDAIIENSTFRGNPYSWIEFSSGGGGSVVRNNTFVATSSTTEVKACIEVHSGSAAGTTNHILFEGNRFSDTKIGTEGCINLYLGAEGSIVRDNIFDTLTTAQGDAGAAVQVQRSGRALIENNTFFRTQYGVAMSERSAFTTIRNNIFDHNTSRAITHDITGFTTRLCETTTFGNVYDTNYFNANGADVYYRTQCTTWQIPAYVKSVTGDCLMMDPNNQDFSLDPNSPCRDVALIGTPVPAGGGSRRDVGAKEYGATGPPYASYNVTQSSVAAASSVRWTFEDPTLLMRRYWPGLYSIGDTQAAFQVQIDSSPYFNSDSSIHPLYETALTTSASGAYALDPNLLTAGTYYVRVRTTDAQAATIEGQWSDGRVSFTVP